MLNELGLFAGIGGISLGLERAGLATPTCFVEIDGYAQKVLQKRWPEVPIWDDVTTFHGEEGDFDIISGGFPCQDISVAGKGKGIKQGTRSSLWFEFHRIISEIRPLFAVIENVPMLSVRGGTRVIADLAEIGYDVEWSIISAKGVGANHLRKRMFIVAYPKELHCYGGNNHKGECVEGGPVPKLRDGCWQENVADTKGIYRDDNENDSQHEKTEAQKILRNRSCSRRFNAWWSVEPNLGRVADGVPSRVDRLKCLGNAVVPQCAEYIGRLIMEAMK